MRYKLVDICKVINGRAYKQDELLEAGKYPVLRVGNFFSSDRWYYSNLELNSEKYCEKGDLLYAWSASFGPKIWNGEKAIYHYHIWKLIPDENIVDKYYLYYWLLFSAQVLTSGTHGSVMAHITKREMENQAVDLPDKIMQEKISSILRKLDNKIGLNERINNHLEQQVQALYCDIFDVHVHPEWPECHISDLGTVVGGSTPSKAKPEYYAEDGIAWITPKDLSVNKSKFISRGEHDISELGLQNSSASVMPPGTVLFSSRAPIGYIAIADGNVTTNQGFKSVVPYPEIGTAFVYYYLKNNLEIIEGMASGSTFKEVSGSIMKSVPAFIPDSDALARFNDFCAPVFSEQRHLEQQNIKLSALRDTLLPRLMSGELDVSNLDL